MSQTPQRPFVPHRTPTPARSAVAASEFRLYTPFVPGPVSDAAELNAPLGSATAARAWSDANVLRPIEDFLETLPPLPPAYRHRVEDLPDVGDFEEEVDQLPPVEHFTDSLPDVTQLPSAEPGSIDSGIEENASGAPASDTGESGWGETDWQHYDWRAAAALGEGQNEEASSAWATTDWDGLVPRARELRNSAAHAIAKALDEIAQRIRAGEVVAPGNGALDPTK
ncbi:MAG TPA: hypothetical protein VGO75_13870, partial [Gemmatimonadaceae bacterium]|nr:hypothetical protein [Gemmatimonadaceae bacterium]